jgi:hypothetical protein
MSLPLCLSIFPHAQAVTHSISENAHFCISSGGYTFVLSLSSVTYTQKHTHIDSYTDYAQRKSPIHEELNAFFPLIRHGPHRKRKKMGHTDKKTDSKVIGWLNCC